MFYKEVVMAIVFVDLNLCITCAWVQGFVESNWALLIGPPGKLKSKIWYIKLPSRELIWGNLVFINLMKTNITTKYLFPGCNRNLYKVYTSVESIFHKLPVSKLFANTFATKLLENFC